MEAEEQKNVIEGAPQQAPDVTPPAEAATEEPGAGAQEGAGQGTQTPEAGSEEETPRMLLRKRMSTINTESNYDEDPEALARDVMSYIDKIEGDQKSTKEFFDKLYARAQQSPSQAAVLIDWAEGDDFPTAIRKNMGDEALVMKEGMEGWDAYQKAGQDRDEAYKKHRELIEEISSNAQLSQEAFNEFLQENGISEEDGQKLWESMQAELEDMSKGKYSKDAFKRFHRSATYDADIASAREQGRQEGADEKVKMERKRMEGSGLPGSAAGNGRTAEPSKQEGNDTLRILKGISRYK